jgi:phosphate transport system substrate-binding protein
MQSLKTRLATLALAAIAGLTFGASADLARAEQISGAGATFPYPIYAKWAEAYNKEKNVALNYQSIGSGGGIKQINAKTVDFGASDMPLKADELQKSGLVQFPTVIGGVVPVINLKGIAPGQVKLTGDLLAQIFLGKIAKWNDKAIAAVNAGVNLPATDIAVVHRSDGSGTTFIFANYLAKVNKEWETKVGVNTSLEWPVGLGGKGNEGVAALVSQTEGAIGYVEYAYASQNLMTYTQVKNLSGAFVKPTSAAFQAAAANADWAKAPGFYLLLTEQPGEATWPISGATFILMHAVQDKPDTARMVLGFFDWAYKNGGKMAEGLDYVPMPEKVVALIKDSWKAGIKGADGKPVLQ